MANSWLELSALRREPCKRWCHREVRIAGHCLDYAHTTKTGTSSFSAIGDNVCASIAATNTYRCGKVTATNIPSIIAALSWWRSASGSDSSGVNNL